MALSWLAQCAFLLLLTTGARAGPSPLVAAHAGSSGEMPDQALDTLLRAVDDDADMVEFDLFVTKDKKLVVIHDLDLSKTTDVAKRAKFASRKGKVNLTTTGESLGFKLKSVDGYIVNDFNLSEIQQLRKIQSKAFRSKEHDLNYTVPSFAEVLEKLKDKNVSLIVDLKFPSYQNKLLNISMEDLVLKELKAVGLHNKTKLDGRRSKVYLASMEEDAVRKLLNKTDLPCIVTKLYSPPNDAEIDKFKSLRLHAFNIWKLPSNQSKDMIYNKKIKDVSDSEKLMKKWPKLIKKIHDKGMKVFCFLFGEKNFRIGSFADDIKEIEKFREFGVDGLLSDYPKRVRGILDGSIRSHAPKISSMFSLRQFIMIEMVLMLLLLLQ